MDIKEEMKRYRTRWEAVEEIEIEELRGMSIEEHWRQINSIARFAMENGWKHGDDDEMNVFLRWAELKRTK